MPHPEIGEKAPSFALPGHDGKTHTLEELLDGTRALVIFFYPKDETPGCTAEACSFRDIHAELAAAGARVVGVSSDPPDAHAAFREHHDLHYLLLSDEDGAVRRAYGVRPTLGLLPGRETFVIDADGVVRARFRSQLRTRAHAREAMSTVRMLVGEDGN
ncbi:MAG: peroxiredoxin [Deltaproteobacteria bacterium]|nr:MAG: peroxiredoxin [Deltaproteobacteria bacterium]